MVGKTRFDPLFKNTYDIISGSDANDQNWKLADGCLKQSIKEALFLDKFVQFLKDENNWAERIRGVGL